MPSTYAHYRMGKEVAEELTGEAWHTLSMYRQLYLIGLHGPDILFYYRPLKSNVINGIGYGMHARPGIEFFEHAVKRTRITRHRTLRICMALCVILRLT